MNARMRDAIGPGPDREWAKGLPAQLGARKFRLLVSAWCRTLLEPELEKALAKDPHIARAQRGVEAAFETSDRFADTGKTKKALGDEVIAIERLRQIHGREFGAPVLLVL